MDLAILPTGERGWFALAKWASENDDRLENFYFEKKTDIDLNTKPARHRLAKFILASAHRDPVSSAKYFGGHAIMLVGVGDHAFFDVPKFEARELHLDIERFTGHPGPQWDHVWIRVDDDTQVLAVVVGPSTGDIWPSQADGVDIYDGDIYYRGHDETRKIKGKELNRLLDRFTHKDDTQYDVQVDVTGTVYNVTESVDYIISRLDEQVRLYKENLPFEGDAILSPKPGSGHSRSERRSESEFKRQVDSWESAIRDDPFSALEDDVSKRYDGVSVHIVNHVEAPLNNVRVDLRFDGPVRALRWQSGYNLEAPGLFTDRPVEWGKDTSYSDIARLQRLASAPVASDDIDIQQYYNPAVMGFEEDFLRPTYVSSSSDMSAVIAMLSEDPLDITVEGDWIVTASELKRPLHGRFSIKMVHRNFRE